MARGDQIYVMRPLAGFDGVYQHHGIDCGDGTVIHYYKGEGEPVVRQTTYETFARGNPVYTKDQPVAYVADRVIERAQSRFGERRYNLLTNNCEHFATWCKTGRSESAQLLGVDVTQLNPFNTKRMIEGSLSGSDPAVALREFQLAFDRVAIAESQLQTQISQLQTDINTWQRIAQLALTQGKEAAARAALGRKVEAKRQLPALQTQLHELNELHATLSQNTANLRKQLV
jgi:hypothetical protein